MAVEQASPSALAHFDPADLLDALSTGIVMLDAQLCPVYANVAAQDLLAFSLKMARGRPFTDLLHEPEGLRRILRRALASGEGIADRELAVRPASSPRDVRTLDVTITPLSALTGRHLLLELADTTQRQRISRENDLLARLDGTRLMVRQLAHEIKNPLGGLRGAAQLLGRRARAAGGGAARVHSGDHRRGGPPHRAGRLDGESDALPEQELTQRARDL
jgi:two-component system, NtrC family, nitrogen regulation sensor histidine kinase GlnL